jgi:hypothetical protein
MNVNIPLPGNLTFKDWAEKFIGIFPKINISYPQDHQDWTKWGQLLMNIPEFKEIPTPLESLYGNDWQRWAILMIARIKEI